MPIPWRVVADSNVLISAVCSATGNPAAGSDTPRSVNSCTMAARTSTVVRLTGNYQVSVPKRIRDTLGLKLGDFLDTSIEHGAVVLRPKVLLDPGAMAADRARKGIGVSRAYDDVDEFIGDLKKAAAKSHRQPLARRTRRKK